MTSITILSNELIEIILKEKAVSIKDVVNFGATCSRFLAVVNDDNLLWQRKLYQRWPYFKKIYDKRIQNKEDISFKDDVKENVKCRNELRCYLLQMSDTLFHKHDLANVDLEHFDVLFCPSMGVHTMRYYFLVDELLCLIAMSPSPDCNLTYKYYGEKLLPFVHQSYLKDVWQKFKNSPKEQQLLEQAAFIISQWYQPLKRILYLDVEASLDSIAHQVLESLKDKHCDHPIFSTPAKQFAFWKCNNINDNQWSAQNERHIIDELRTVLFDKLGFCGRVDPDCTMEHVLYPEAEHFLIDCVLETKVGSAMSLAIIFQSVARRLGVRCDLVCFPTHFFLSWKPKCDTENPEAEKYFYIDVLCRGIIRDKNDCPKTRGRKCPIESFNKHNEISSTGVVLRMINSLQMVNNRQHYQLRTLQIRTLMELRHMIQSRNVETIENLCRCYIRFHINPSSLVSTLQGLLNGPNSITSVEANRAEMLLRAFELYIHSDHYQPIFRLIRQERPEKLKYAVGMIVTSHRHVGNCTGVIIWWDEDYSYEKQIPTRISRILQVVQNINSNPLLVDAVRPPFVFSQKQPFYTVLCEDGNTYYVPQDDLTEANPPKQIQHKEIGRYFCRFALSHYVPNSALTRYFPRDTAILDTLPVPTSPHNV
ncbi:PREDICTED: F-box only protein 21-like [Vollenhovia emeryi]|uniref:F-box only protein 21-like n=1 Tax=Vollenhovia emeryi TaxID=411798 RepID=UPI0005F3F488|nr:PREDICTED: F-box only protein 21-like [Vollenhovia emeryi]